MISFLVIATKRYTKYAYDLIQSLDTYMQDTCEVLLLTDDESLFYTIGKSLSKVSIHTRIITSLGWPHATLLRYEILLNHFSASRGDVLCYLDADTRMVRETRNSDFLSCLSMGSSIALVRHPGYFQTNVILRTLTRSRLGPWETRSLSSAYVPFSMRHNYVCGGVLFGQRSAFINMCNDLKLAINSDVAKNIIAKHNDESYLNRWAMERSVVRLSPEWAFASGYRNLDGLIPRIEVIHKPSNWTRES